MCIRLDSLTFIAACIPFIVCCCKVSSKKEVKNDNFTRRGQVVINFTRWMVKVLVFFINKSQANENCE